MVVSHTVITYLTQLYFVCNKWSYLTQLYRVCNKRAYLTQLFHVCNKWAYLTLLAMHRDTMSLHRDELFIDNIAALLSKHYVYVYEGTVTSE